MFVQKATQAFLSLPRSNSCIKVGSSVFDDLNGNHGWIVLVDTGELIDTAVWFLAFV